MTDATLPMIRSHLSAANRLIAAASEDVLSFFVSTGELDGPKFVGFLRDSLVEDPTKDEKALPISTGGVAVSAQLYYLAPYLPYLEANGHPMVVRQLKERRLASYKFLFGPEPLRIPKGFGDLNPLTSSIWAYLGCQHSASEPPSPRAILFIAVTLNLALKEKWPTMENVDKSHPYVAYNVLRAIREIRNTPACLLPLLDINLTDFAQTLNVDSPPSAPSIKAAFADLQKGLPKDAKSIPACIDEAMVGFGNEAEQYLWGQIGYAPTPTREQFDSLNYDPVGTCFALNVLLDAMTDQPGTDSTVPVKRILGEYASLVFQSVQHVLKALTPSGSLPYGIPFAYDPRGTGAFATSIAGLAAFARFLTEIFRAARPLDYPSSAVLRRIIEDNILQLELLFGLIPILEGTRRSSAIWNGKRKLTGWWTDRAPSRSRVESWVTIEVLQFAVYIRELLQECGQFLVMRKYGAVRIVDEAAWPYNSDGSALIRDSKRKVLQDPDEKETEFSPIGFLHQSFGLLLNGGGTRADSWDTPVSSVLLFGPPGTAKSTTVRSLAAALNWHFVELTPSNFVIDGMEKIEQRAKEICDDLSLLRETVVLFDELDSLLVDREILDPGDMIQFVVPAMLPRLQALSKAGKKQRVLLAIATNYYDRLDAAMVRLGRIDRQLLILPYNSDARMILLENLLKKKNFGDTDLCRDETICSGSALYVFQEMDELADKLVKAANFRKLSPAAICSSLYLTRIPNVDERTKRIRSTHRLALEVCEVVGRLVGDRRALSSESDIDEVRKRLDAMRDELEKRKQLKSYYKEWLDLCDVLRKALTPEHLN